MKVIGAGFGRTGTMSLKVALEELGAGPCLHSLESLRSPLLSGESHWQRLARGEQIDWRSALEGYGSTVDWLGARYYPEILAAWPEAKVILSVREPNDWYESCNQSLHVTGGLKSTVADGTQAPALMEAVNSAIWEEVFEGRFGERDHALAVYTRHTREVAERVPPEKLLVYDIREGWAPLCAFLDVAVPTTPFPHLNTRASFWTRFGVLPAARSSDSAGGRLPQSRGKVADRSGDVQQGAVISGLSIADPPRCLDQRQVLDLVGLSGDEFAEGIFARCGVHRRRMDLDEQMLSSSLQGRTERIESLLLDYSAQAVEALAVDPKQIGTLITASLYSLGCPTLAHRLIERFDMDRSSDKYHIVGVGCASAIPLMRLGSQCLAGHPGKQVLIVAAESMSGLICSATPDDPRSKTVATAIFGDGCAAMLLDGGPSSDEPPAPAGIAAALQRPPQVIDSQVHQIPGTLNAVRIDADDLDSHLGLVRELPDIAGEHLRALVDEFLSRSNITGHMIDHWIIHPGGRRIIECAQEALGLPDAELTVSYEALAEHGNVGTPSIFYVLAETIEKRAPTPGQYGLMVTIGPGVSVGLMLVRF